MASKGAGQQSGTIRWGILGCGRIAHTFAQDMAWVEGSEILAAAARQGDSAQAFAQQYGIPVSYQGYDALCQDPEIDAIYVATPHSHHLHHAEQALAAGKAVLCEKPLTVNLSQSQTLIQAVKSHQGYLMEGMWTYFLPAIQQAKQWVEQGRIGRLLQIKADFGYPMIYDPQGRAYNPQLGGGAVLDMGIYPLALAWLFCPEMPETIHQLQHHAATGVEDELLCLLRFPQYQVDAVLGTSFRAKLPNVAYLIGDKGQIAIEDFWRAPRCALYHQDELVEQFEDGRQGSGFEFQIAAVNRDLCEGRLENRTVPHQTSLALAQLMDRLLNRPAAS
ncbi:Gfo/Idh/MocA family protein [Ferrimonas marina]|uniref:Predicted dehydrogenase n=1 Tax=Ferrimonas marina TaxID=299255 RepID=A0A1M5NDH0_9GAMM|nr:Gfo/Idh/MocA family oxidoreductase [Ferrimonas marina]SHG87505.1 Predicted dehydrogenase [Ferrimonas marina]